mgnify:CR=1 FL=1
MSVLSLYIPIINNGISEQYIKTMFKNNNIGQVMRVDFVKNVEKNRREAFIHFDEWFNTDESKKLKDDILNLDTQTRFVYNTKSNKYWPLHVNKNAHKRINNPKYTMIKNDIVSEAFKNNLNSNVKTIVNNKKDNTAKKMKTYASVVSLSPTNITSTLEVAN